MKKSLLIITAASVLLASCQRSDDPAAEQVQEAITFGASIQADITKAYSENTAAEIQANGFNVAGVIVNGDSRSLLFNEKAVWGGSSYAPQSQTYNWPASGTMDFFGVYPTSQSLTVTSGQATLAYTHNGDDDLLGAYSAGQSKSASSVALTFNHLLTLVRFTAEGTDTGVKYKVNLIKVTTPDGGTYTYSTDSWSLSGTTVQDTYSSTETALSGVTAISGGLTAVPSVPTVYVEWSTYQNDGTTKIADYNGTKALDKSMEQGKECTINLRLPNSDASEITFSITVNPWGSQTGEITFE